MFSERPPLPRGLQELSHWLSHLPHKVYVHACNVYYRYCKLTKRESRDNVLPYTLYLLNFTKLNVSLLTYDTHTLLLATTQAFGMLAVLLREQLVLNGLEHVVVGIRQVVGSHRFTDLDLAELLDRSLPTVQFALLRGFPAAATLHLQMRL